MNENNSNNDEKKNSEQNNDNKQNKKTNYTIIIYLSACIIFLIFMRYSYNNFVETQNKHIKESIDRFERISKNKLNNFYKSLESQNTNTSKTEFTNFIKNTIDESLKLNIELLESSIKDNYNFGINSVSFWLAFLSLIMIIFTILGIYANNKILESNQRESELILKKLELKVDKIYENINKKFKEQSSSNLKENKNILQLFNKALKEEDNNNIDNAIELYSQILEIYKNDIDALINRGALYYNKYEKTKEEEYFENALDDYNNALKINDKDTSALNNRGNLYSTKYEKTKEEEYFKSALDDYDNVLKINNKDAGAFYNRGILYSIKYEEIKKEEDFNKALDDYKSALKINDKYADALNNRGNLYSTKYEETKKEEDFNKALHDYENALKINDKYADALNNIAFLYLVHCQLNDNDKKSLDKAKEYLIKSENNGNKTASLIINKGIASYLNYNISKNINDLEESEKYLNESIKLNKIQKDIGETYYYLYLVYEKYIEVKHNKMTEEELIQKRDEYLEESEKHGYKHFI